MSTLANRNIIWRRAKFAAIPVLAISLGMVLYWNQTRSSATDPHASAVQSDDKRSAGPLQPAAGKRLSRESARWPHADFKEIINCDAFQPWPSVEQVQAVALVDTKSAKHDGHQNSAATKAPVTEAVGKVPAAYRGKVHAFYQDRSGNAALYGSRVIHRGDILEGGGKVVEVTATGITVELQ